MYLPQPIIEMCQHLDTNALVLCPPAPWTWRYAVLPEVLALQRKLRAQGCDLWLVALLREAQEHAKSNLFYATRDYKKNPEAKGEGGG